MKTFAAVRKNEVATLVLSFSYFFLLLSAYYILRPVRDGLVALLGTEELKNLNLVVFATMLAITPLFGALMARIPRRTLLPAIYAFFLANLLAFSFAFANSDWLAMATRVFFVWIMVFSMFVISIFWSLMADLWTEEQGRRLFGIIAAGGSVGGIVGPQLAQQWVTRIGNSGLILLACLLLALATACLLILLNRQQAQPDLPPKTLVSQEALGGSSLQSLILVMRSPFLLGIAALVCVSAVASQFAYIETGKLAKSLYGTPEALTVFYAGVDFWTNVVTLCFQTLVIGWLTSTFGIKAPLIGLSVIGCLTFVPIALSPTLGALAITSVIRRATEYGLGKPGRDMLYTVATPQEKYLAKNAIDTLIYRGSDSLGNWFHSVLIALGMTLAGLSWTMAVVVGGSVFISLAAARGYYRRGGK